MLKFFLQGVTVNHNSLYCSLSVTLDSVESYNGKQHPQTIRYSQGLASERKRERERENHERGERAKESENEKDKERERERK